MYRRVYVTAMAAAASIGKATLENVLRTVSWVRLGREVISQRRGGAVAADRRIGPRVVLRGAVTVMLDGPASWSVAGPGCSP